MVVSVVLVCFVVDFEVVVVVSVLFVMCSVVWWCRVVMLVVGVVVPCVVVVVGRLSVCGCFWGAFFWVWVFLGGVFL